MTGKTFMNSLMNGQADIIRIFLDMIDALKIDYCLEDVLQGKIWAYADEPRIKSKRQKAFSVSI